MSPYTDDVPHDLEVRYTCPGCERCNSARAVSGKIIQTCNCGSQVEIQKHPNGRITVLCDPKEECSDGRN